MLEKNEIKNLACVQLSKIDMMEKIEHLFFEKPNRIVYVLDGRKLYGIITLGDFKRNYPEVSLAINKSGKRLVNSRKIEKDAEEIFIQFPKIKRIPVVNEDGELLYEMCIAREKETEEKSDLSAFLENTDWLEFYIKSTNYKKICIIDQNHAGKKIKEKFIHMNISIIEAKEFTRAIMDLYDLVIDFDLIEYDRRHELLRRINRKYTNQYSSPQELKLFQETVKYYREQKRKGVQFLFFEAPSEFKLNNITKKQKDRMKDNRSWPYYYKKAELYDDEFKEMFGKNEYAPMIKNIFELPDPIKKGESIYYEEYRSQFYNIAGGYRITLNKEFDKYTQDIDMYGPCIVFGLFAEDKETIASHLQKKINDSELKRFCVNNYGVRASEIKEMIYCMKNKNHRAGDIVIVVSMAEEIDFFKRLDEEIEVYELSDAFNQSEDIGLFFIDKPVHCNYKANRLIADEMFKVLKQINMENKVLDTGEVEFSYNTSVKNEKYFENNQELKRYTDYLAQFKISSDQKNIGAIVMNCNPFTNGHRYLIESAAKKVEQLYIFVVEEDKSYFKFEDRIKLVKSGTADLKNVTVLPSGKFMISAITFPEYFVKDSNQEVTIDTSMDIEVFAQYIAPVLNINRRFVGEEPIDYVTRQYNETMKKLLPCYGINVVEIKRKSVKDSDNKEIIISASLVREYLKKKEWREIEALVPSTTYEYLLQHFQ